MSGGTRLKQFRSRARAGLMQAAACGLAALALLATNDRPSPAGKPPGPLPLARAEVPRFDAAFPLTAPQRNSLLARWLQKPVLDTLLIDDMEQDGGWVATGIGQRDYTTDVAKDGKRSLRFRTGLRDPDHFRRHRTAWDSYTGGVGGYSGVELTFDQPRDWSAFNRISFWVYPHRTDMLVYTLHVEAVNEGTVSTAVTPGFRHDIADLKPGEWNQIVIEIPHLERNRISRFRILQELIGHHPEEKGIAICDIDRLELQKVVADQYEGWSVAPGKFAFSHVGYRPGDPKVALLEGRGADGFQLLDDKGNVAFTGRTSTIENRNGQFRRLDFSELRAPGMYRIRCGRLESQPFPVGDDVWLHPTFAAANFFFCERCGFQVPGIHGVCHQDWQGFHGTQQKIINGGWHDAADCSQAGRRTCLAIFAMMRTLDVLRRSHAGTDLEERFREEIVWGLRWLLKTRFGNGFRMCWSTMMFFSDNRIGTPDDVLAPAQNVPWQNFLAAAVECQAAILFEKSDPDLARQAAAAALEDWRAAIDAVAARENGSNDTGYDEAAWGVVSSLLLWERTGDAAFRERALQFGTLLLRCQEQTFLDGIPITGFFYTKTDREKIVHNNHRAHEADPLIALAMLCRALPEHAAWIDWYSAAVLHSEFFMKRGSHIAAPYYHLPNSVWSRAEILGHKDEVHVRQINEGTHLPNGYVLRTYPVWDNPGFHGNTNVQLSATWALAEASALRKDVPGMQLVGKQLEWVFGANPFGESLMYGVGYDFRPLHAVRFKNMVGALPVGIDCMSGDKPYWPGTNGKGTYREIWVSTVTQFLGALSVYVGEDHRLHEEQIASKPVQLQAEGVRAADGTVHVTLTVTGEGTHQIDVRGFNASIKARTGVETLRVDLTAARRKVIDLDLKVIEKNRPYVAVFTVAGDRDVRAEIVGASVESSLASPRSLQADGLLTPSR
ncbi:MAG: glycoside hydrolase family 9 protein [Planctomycetia bacterium]|jgi:hypothetical protein